MKSLFLVLAALAVIAICDDVVVLTPDNFYSVLDGSKHALVEFYAPWCGHCKHLEPEYSTAATALRSDKDVVIAKVDADAHRDLGGAFDVKGFPTIKFFTKGESAKTSKGQDYNGGRTAEDIVNYINKETGSRGRIKKAPSNVVVLTTQNFDSIVVNNDNDVLVEFYAPWCGHCKKLAPDYEKVANAFAGDKNVVIAKIDCDAEPTMASKFGVTGFPTIKFFARGAKENPETYEAGRDPQSFVDFINQKSGTQRNPDGSLKEEAGRVAALDSIAARFAASPSAALISEAESEVKNLAAHLKTWGETYVKLMKALEKKGADFVSQETSRVTRMLKEH